MSAMRNRYINFTSGGKFVLENGFSDPDFLSDMNTGCHEVDSAWP